MKHILTLLFLFVFFATTGYSQQPITVRDSGLVVISNDTAGRIRDLSVVSAVGQAQINGTWDLSQARYYQPISAFSRQAAVAGSFPAASFMYQTSFPYNIASWSNIYSYYSLDSTGIFCLGQNSFIPSNASRQMVTGNSRDSLNFPVQYVPFTPALKRIGYPITMGSIWSGNTSYSLSTQVYSTVGSLVNVPMTIKVHITTMDTVVGWGKMRVSLRDSNKVSAYVPVLQVHEESISVDSFFINGLPVPDSVLNSLGLTQGTNRTAYSTMFYRAGEIEPLLTTLFSFPYHQRAVYSTAVINRLPEGQTNSVHSLHKGQLSVFPNPCKNRLIHVRWPEAGAGLQYVLTNFAGSLIASGALPSDGKLALADHLAAGFYSLSLTDAEGNKEAVPLVLE